MFSPLPGCDSAANRVSDLARGRTWNDDTPDADLVSLTYRLYQVTGLKVRPGLSYVDITPKDLPNYPFVYVAAAGSLVLTDDEVTDVAPLPARRRFPDGG